MIKRRHPPKPNLNFDQRVVGNTHMLKEKTSQATTTRCGVIADRHTTIKTTCWHSEITCRACLIPS